MTVGIFDLGDFPITSAGTTTGSVVDGLDGTQAVTISARLGYGSGGSTVIVRIETSLNQGDTWVEIARFDFAASGDEKFVNLSGYTPKTTPYSVSVLNAEGAVDGILGDRFQAVVTSTGTYGGSTVLAVRMSVR